jgi:hypothetical protein
MTSEKVHELALATEILVRYQYYSIAKQVITALQNEHTVEAAS